MLMTGDEIGAAREAGEIVIEPFCEANVNTASYDVTLGPFCYRQVSPRRRPRPFTEYQQGREIRIDPNYNPYDENHIAASWRLDRAVPAFTQAEQEGIDDDDFVIPIKPKEIILAHTLEFIGSVPFHNGIAITTQMHSRSGSVRNCIDVCGSGGWGDHGFCARWTMEVVNTSSYYVEPLVAGRRIAQISFFRTTPILRNYAVEGKYHAGMSLEQLRQSWHPGLMLPRSYLDREVGKPNPHRALIRELIHKYPIEE